MRGRAVDAAASRGTTTRPSSRSRPNAASSGSAISSVGPRAHRRTVACRHGRRRRRPPRARGRARPDGRCSPTRSRCRLYARDASMVEGGCALVALPTTRPSRCRRACGWPPRTACRSCRAAAAPASPGAATPIGDALVVVTARMTRIVEVRPEDRLAWVEPGRAEPRSVEPPAAERLHVRARPVEPADLVDRRQREHERRRSALPRLRGDERTRARARRRDARRLARARSAPRDPRRPATTCAASSSAARERSASSPGCACASCRCRPPCARCCSTSTTVEDCAATVSAIIARGVVPAAVEMMDQGIVRAVERFAHAGYPTDAAAVLLVEVDGTDGRRRGADPRRSRPRRAAHGVSSVRVAADDAERALLWKGRKSAFGAIAQIAPHYHLHDCVVPRTKLVEVLAGVYAIAERHALIVTNVFHAGDGNLHPLFSFDRSRARHARARAAGERRGRAPVRRCRRRAQRRARHRPREARLHAARVHRARISPRRRACASAFDPDGRMNPRKVLPDGARCGEFAIAARLGRRRGRRRRPPGGLVDLMT